MSDIPYDYSARARTLKLLWGVGLLALGFTVFHLSKTLDPDNRGALLSIFAILFGFHYLGQAMRGHPVVVPAPEPPPATAAISDTRTFASFVAAWLVPGLGHWIIGRRGKAILYFVTITSCFVAGVILAHGRNLDFERDKIYFWAYGWNGLETLLAWFFARDLRLDHVVPNLAVGYLYTSVACLLNVVVMMDALTTCLRSSDPEAA